MKYNLPLMDRGVTQEEQDALRHYLRRHQACGGRGNGGDGCEKAICDFFRTKHHGLSKSYFDLFVNSGDDEFRGVSAKKKGLKDQATLMHIYWGSGTGVMELSNISTWWKKGHMAHYTVRDYQEGKYASEIGALVLDNLQRLRDASPMDRKSRLYAKETGRKMDLDGSRFLNVLWNRETPDVVALTFDTSMPKSLQWSYEGESLVGRRGRQIVLRWYGSGRGHILYTPPVSEAIQCIRL